MRTSKREPPSTTQRSYHRQVESLSHTRWECQYHVVFMPKYRKKVLFGQIRKELGSGLDTWVHYRGDLGPQQRGRMTSLRGRQHAVALIQEAQSRGARLAPACELLNIHVRTYHRWMQDGEVQADQRPEVPRPTPSNKYTQEERDGMTAVCNQPEYRSRPPAFIVADQLDQARYVGSESTLYRVLREQDQNHRCGRQSTPRRKRMVTTHQADGPNEIWSWNITWLPGPARGVWFYLYLIMDIYSRKIVGHEIYTSETDQLACEVIEKACWREHLAVHDPNMYAATSETNSLNTRPDNIQVFNCGASSLG